MDNKNANATSGSNFTKCAINKLSNNKDIIIYGKQVLERMNLEKVRANKKARHNCYKEMSSDVVQDVATMNEMDDGNNGNEVSDDFMITSMQRLQDAVVTNGEDA